MANNPPVHVEPRQDGWAVVREGNERATSVHPTQAEAAQEGRELARRDETEFFLHAQDGRIREHNSYDEASRSEKEEAAGHATPGAREDASPEASGSEKATDVAQGDELFEEAPDDAEEVHALAAEQRDDRSATLQERYAGYEVHDVNGERIGKIDYLFVDENDQLEYIGVKTGIPEAKVALIPMAVVRVDDDRRIAEVNAVKTMIKEGPAFESDEEITPEFERQVHSYYGLGRPTTTGERGAYSSYYAQGAAGTPAPRRAALGATDRAGLADDDELRVRRVEEELRAGTRERDVGAVRVRKRVVTERRREEVPTRREEVRVERVPVAGEVAAEAEIGEDEVVIPLTEEEVVVEKRPVAKEEIRIRKEVVEDTEVVEADVRREEVDIDDEGTRRAP